MGMILDDHSFFLAELSSLPSLKGLTEHLLSCSLLLFLGTLVEEASKKGSNYCDSDDYPETYQISPFLSF